MNNPTGIFQFDPEMAPDSDFERGELQHLIVNNLGRLLDARRTPVRLIALQPDIGMFEVEILGFEDKGARWLQAFEDIGNYQFALQSRRATDAEIQGFRDTIDRLDRPLSISCNDRLRQQTIVDLKTERDRARAWLGKESQFFAAGQPLSVDNLDGFLLLYEDLEAFMAVRGLADMENRFATQWVSNPESGEFIKGHRIVIAELGLTPFEGKIVRDEKLFDEPWAKESRALHVLARMAFVQEVFWLSGIERPILYRTLSCEGPLQSRVTKRALIPATFSRDVAEAFFAEHDMSRTIAMFRQTVPLERLFMTYLETRQFNHPFKEAEAILIADPDNLAF